MKEETKEKIAETVEEAVEAAVETVQKPWAIKFAKFGFYAKGFLFLVIGALAILVALGYRSGKLTDTTGALAAIAQAPFGKGLLIVFMVGAIGHGAWNVLRGVADVDNAGGGWQGIPKRVLAGGIGAFYFLLAWSAWRIIEMARVTDANGEIPQTLTAILFAFPLGALLVFLIGLGVLIAGIHQGYFGVFRKFEEYFFTEKLAGASLYFFYFLGILSFLARAIIFLLIGYFMIEAAINYNPEDAIGMDGALYALSQTYYGKTLLFLTALGLASQGVLAFYEVRYRRIY